MKTIYCKFCNKQFTIKLYLIKEKGNFCSSECYDKYRLKEIDVICESCGKIFNKKTALIKRTSHNFCSRNCYNKVIGKSRIVHRYCVNCNNELKTHKERNFCSWKCSLEHRWKINPPNDITYKKYKLSRREWDKIGDSIRIRDNNICQKCGKMGNKTPVHHIIPAEHGGNNEPSNLICLCQSCHMKIEFKWKDYVEILQNYLNKYFSYNNFQHGWNRI